MIPTKSLANPEELNNRDNILPFFETIISDKNDLLFLDNEQTYIYKYLEEYLKKKEQEEKEELIKNASTMYIIADSGLNIRNEKLDIIETLPVNSEITVLKNSLLMTEDGSYSLILHEDDYAYAYSKYLSSEKKVIQPKPVKTTKPVKTANSIKTQTQSVQSSGQGKYLGKFSATAYCNCTKCCGKWAGGPTASGAMPQAGRTIAVDPKVIPLGTKVLINGQTYVAEDTGSAIKGNKIDIYQDSHSSALNWGRRTVDIYLVS
jgi:3D (Asp-Asp-Asp) domain-containing protein